ncbi:ferredoxin [Phyllobacterium phragmitis]|uniref:Ferredoxin n=1 Tax=Phyllobacterium phragmitis TaxID=2670329 RepID=A0A2S9IQ00_9HYPH|nr:pyridoxamine 5'-phosphate oxidase family protein [Phyllobacterium phragmitis]PRD42607.1 ferredoxin [Phyllobacterium phragmitis]
MVLEKSPFHAGELEAQRRAKVGDVASWAGSFIRDHMPDQHRDFFAALPFLVVAGGDGEGWPWVTIIEGPAGFASSPDPRRLSVAARLHPQDPLSGALSPGAGIGILGIELATRRRNRLNGVVRATDDGFVIEVRQSFGNCPQYIHERAWRRVETGRAAKSRISHRLDPDQQVRIAAADTLFIGSGHSTGGDRSSDGYDASHRGGSRGFVRVSDDGMLLRIPDYAGNKYFNTIGNLVRDPRVGLLFVDFATGGLLHIIGRARIDWAPKNSHDPNALRMIEVAVEKVIDRPAALALRWSEEGAELRPLKVIDKVAESDRITSFHLASPDDAALPPFEAGQHLPVERKVPGQPDRIRRTYSLSGSPHIGTYRISVKREDRGIASTFLHAGVEIGDTIEARPPAGDFILPGGQAPVVLVSAGVGVTPMLSMLHDAVTNHPGRWVWFIHGARDGRSHAFRTEVDALIGMHANIMRRIVYSAPRETDVPDVGFDATGRVTAKDLLALRAGAEAHYMLCGPARFLADIRTGLEAGGVPPGHIHFETFGPSG